MSGNTRVVVTGATGFIGRVLCGKLLDLGHEVVAMVRTPGPGPWTSAVRVALGQDPVDPALLEGVDTVFHLAGKAHVRARSVAEIQEYEDVHVRGTRSLLLAARAAGVRTFVLLGSVKAMGEGSCDVWDETTPCAPQNPYGRTKLAAERLVLEDLPFACSVVLRPALVYGRGSKGNLDLLIRAVRTGLFPVIIFPDNRRSMVHVDDVVRACVLASVHPAACGKTYVLTDGREYSTNEILAWIHAAVGKKAVLPLPYGVVRCAASVGDVLERVGLALPFTSDRLDKLTGSARYSSARIQRELGFVPSVDLRTGIFEMAGTPLP